MASPLEVAALEYHEFPTPGKISVVPTKGLTNQRDLALAYSPGVAFACKSIEADPANAARLTSRAKRVGVGTNGTAVLGLGNIGPLAQSIADYGLLNPITIDPEGTLLSGPRRLAACHCVVPLILICR